MNLNPPDIQNPTSSEMRPLSEEELGSVAGGRPRVIIIIVTSDGEVIVIET
jgi:hypothetical protein